jgi:hypothetical protein
MCTEKAKVFPNTPENLKTVVCELTNEGQIESVLKGVDAVWKDFRILSGKIEASPKSRRGDETIHRFCCVSGVRKVFLIASFKAEN